MLRSLSALRSSSLLGSIQFVTQILGVNCTAHLPHGTPDVAQLQQQQVHTSSAPHQSPDADADDIKQQLLGHALGHVKRLGWTRSSITAAAADMQLSPAAVGMFPRAPSELVEHFIAQQNTALEKELQETGQQFRDLPLRTRISSAVRRRLEMNAAHMESWPQALAVVSQPSNAPAALKLLTQLLDSIWYAAGDTATDSSWYTKRAALAGMYLSTELYMLTDYSPGYTDTWQQLERRIDDVLWLGDAAQSAAALPQLLLQALTRFGQQGQQQQQQTAAAHAGPAAAAAVHTQPAAAAAAGAQQAATAAAHAGPAAAAAAAAAAHTGQAAAAAAPGGPQASAAAAGAHNMAEPAAAGVQRGQQ